MRRFRNLAGLALFFLAFAPTALASITLSLAPTTIHVQPGGQAQFAASVSGTTNSVVIWSLNGPACSGIACGQITSGGLYIAPAVAPSPNVITVIATSLADLSVSASAAVIVGSASDVTVSVSPATATVIEGQQQLFVAYVRGTTITKVTWSLTGAACSMSSCGTLTQEGLYTAPPSTPTPPQVTIKAVSVADPTISGSATLTIAVPVSVKVSPKTAQVNAGLTQQFTATVAGSTNTAVTWSVSGSGCSGAACGTISSTGVYTAPSAAPSPAQVTVRATSSADTSKSDTAVVTVNPAIAVQVSPPTAQVRVGGKIQFTASVSNTTNTNVSWSLSGSGCSGAACGTITTSGLYTAPTAVPTAASVTVTAISAADPTRKGSAQVSIEPPIAITLSPGTATVSTGTQQQFTAVVTGTTNTAVTWTLVGAGCSGAACGTITTNGLYTAPSAVPNPAQVSVTATSVEDPSRSATSQVTVVVPLAVTVTPAAVEVLVGGHQQFKATVTGTSNTAVTWTVSGSGCSGAACGTISASGLFTAPGVSPKPSQVTVKATSVADPSKSGSALVNISGPVSLSISPTSALVIVGGSQQFTAAVGGTSNTGVSWSVSGAGCSGTACGTVSTSGLYIAPPALPNPAQVSVTATSIADPSKSATATLTLLLPIILNLSPTSATVVTGHQQQFTVTVSGNANTGVTWTVSCGVAACGQISTTGLYTAPAAVPSPAQVTVKAASAADPNIYKTASVTIISPLTVHVSPASASLVVGASQAFAATVTGSTNQNVTWSLSGAGCSGNACGTISSAGLYVAPATVPNPATIAVKATSAIDTSASATATVTVLPPVKVTITPAAAQVVVDEARQFTAVVTGASNTSVTWSLTGTGCSGTTCGSITTGGLYTAPATIPSPALVSLRATSVADSSKSATAAITIIAPVKVVIAPTGSIVAVNGQEQFRANIVGSTDQGVQWSVSGAACSGAACGTISSTGLYTAPASVPALATVVVTATSLVDPGHSAAASVTLVATRDAKLSGPYAFRFTGFDAGGIYEAVGIFTANGSGEITGVEDVNRMAGPATNVAFTGTYKVTDDNRGTMTWTSSNGSQTFHFALRDAGAEGSLIEFDDSGTSGSARFERQTPSPFTVASLKGGYVFSLVGTDAAGQRIGALSILYFDGSGAVQGGIMDVNQGGTSPTTITSISGVYQISTTGRGSLQLSIPGLGPSIFHFALALTNTGRLAAVSTDPLSSSHPLLSGPAQAQVSNSFGLSTLKGSTVFSLAGQTGGVSEVLVGQIAFDGAAQPKARFDQNVGGTVTTNIVLTGAYGIDVNGSGTLDLDDSNGSTRMWLIYAIGPNHAYLMDVSSAAVGMGELDAQSDQPPFSAADLLGPYAVSSGEPLVSGATLYSAHTDFDGRGAVSGTEDSSSNASSAADQALKGTYSSSSSQYGRKTITLTAPNGATLVLWVRSAGDAVGMQTSPTNSAPVVLRFEQ